MSCTAEELKEHMSQYLGGTVKRFRHWANPRFISTEGFMGVADKAQCHWFVDILATEVEPLYHKAWMEGKASIAQVVLKVQPPAVRPQAVIELTLEDNVPLAYTSTIDATDFPEGTWTFFLGTDGLPDGKFLSVCMIPEEY